MFPLCVCFVDEAGSFGARDTVQCVLGTSCHVSVGEWDDCFGLVRVWDFTKMPRDYERRATRSWGGDILGLVGVCS